MSKLSRNELKDLVKECLVEILSEGLASTPRAERSDNMSHLAEDRRAPRVPTRPASKGMPPRSQSPALNSTIFGASQTRRTNPAQAPAQQPAIVDSVGQITNDPVLAQILADTAMTTLQEQIGAESSKPGSPSLQESVGSPMDLFDGAQNWATLAFSETGGRGQNLKS